MSKRRQKVIVYKGQSAPAPAPAPAPPKPSAPSLLETAVKLVGIGVLVVGVVTLAAPWLRGAEYDGGMPWRHAADRRALPPGMICWTVTRESASGTSHARHCDAAPGSHEEVWDGVGPVWVPPPWRRHWVRDGF